VISLSAREIPCHRLQRLVEPAKKGLIMRCVRIQQLKAVSLAVARAVTSNLSTDCSKKWRAFKVTVETHQSFLSLSARLLTPPSFLTLGTVLTQRNCSGTTMETKFPILCRRRSDAWT
jgi:hypothetical protein